MSYTTDANKRETGEFFPDYRLICRVTKQTECIVLQRLLMNFNQLTRKKRLNKALGEALATPDGHTPANDQRRDQVHIKSHHGIIMFQATLQRVQSSMTRKAANAAQVLPNAEADSGGCKAARLNSLRTLCPSFFWMHRPMEAAY